MCISNQSISMPPCLLKFFTIGVLFFIPNLQILLIYPRVAWGLFFFYQFYRQSLFCCKLIPIHFETSCTNILLNPGLLPIFLQILNSNIVFPTVIIISTFWSNPFIRSFCSATSFSNDLKATVILDTCSFLFRILSFELLFDNCTHSYLLPHLLF